MFLFFTIRYGILYPLSLEMRGYHRMPDGTMMKNSDHMRRAYGKPKRGLYFNIHAKQMRIAHGSHERMRKPGSPGAPTAAAFKQAAKTAHGSGKKSRRPRTIRK